jgi:CCR4-NOT transcription complex subunit 9
LQFGSWNPSEAAYRARETASVVQLIESLNNDATRERAIHLLSKVLEREGKEFFLVLVLFV